jgi:hypothetical protein
MRFAEVGADLTSYFAPDDIDGTCDLISGLIVDPAREGSA